MKNAIFALLVLNCLSSKASDPCGWSEVQSGLRCTILAGNTNVRTGQVVVLTFVVTNITEQPVRVPAPDPGTLSFDTVVTDKNRGSVVAGGHTALAANYGRPDKWTTLTPDSSLSFSFEHAWRDAGSQQVYFAYGSRSGNPPFKGMTTPKLNIMVMEAVGQPDGAANRSQPVRTDTNATPVPAGSGR
jgi:hypothetical protein